MKRLDITRQQQQQQQQQQTTESLPAKDIKSHLDGILLGEVMSSVSLMISRTWL